VIKDQITQRFSKAASTYDTVAFVQHACAQRLVAALRAHSPSPWAPSSILDVGTGTGYVVDNLHPLFPQATYTLNDIAPAMLDYCQNKFTDHGFQYCLGDIETMSISYCDLIVSNFALQWVSDLPCVLKKLYDHSHVLAYTCILEETFSKWYDALESYGISRPYYPNLTQVYETISDLSPAQFWVTSERIPIAFSQGSQLMRYLQHLGASASTRVEMSTLPRSLLTLFPIEVHYHVAYCIIIKE
jgi:malonyl-CoA O-methyltransferase